MTKWVWKGIKTGIKTTLYPGREETARGVSPGRPFDTQFASEKDALTAARRCPEDALRSFSNQVMVNKEKCIHCFKCRDRGSADDFSSASHPASGINTDAAFVNWKRDYEWAEHDDKGHGLLDKAFSQSLNIRIVDAGACGACMSEIKQISSPYYNIHRLGFFITPTPRMADILLVAGPLTAHMADPLKKTFEAMPSPKRVIAVGTCAISGGVFGTGFAVKGGAGKAIPVDIRVPGCPPPPLAIIHALLMAAGKQTDFTKKRK